MDIVSKLPLPEQGQDLSFFFRIGENTAIRHSVAAFAVEEAVFSLTRVEVLLVSSAAGAEFRNMLGRKATLTVQDSRQELPRYFSGSVVEAVSDCAPGGSVVTRVLLLPELHKLENGARYRIFQGLSVPDIVQTVFCEHEIGDVVWQLGGMHASRPFCMQYGESDLAFVQRLLGEEGIFYYFDDSHEAGQKLVLCDGMQELSDCPGLCRFVYGSSDPDVSGDACCTFLSRRDHLERGAGDACHRADLHGRSGSFRLACGHAVALEGYPDAGMNARWYLAAVRHEGFHLRDNPLSGNGIPFSRQSWAAYPGDLFLPATLRSPGLLEKLSQPGSPAPAGGNDRSRTVAADVADYACAFSAIDDARTYSVPQGARPVAAGPQKARVTAVDTADRQMPRCRISFAMAGSIAGGNSDVSCWVNPASLLGASLFAVMPEKGETVIVDFLGGNPDQPVIIARAAGTNRHENRAPDAGKWQPAEDHALRGMNAGLSGSAACRKTVSDEGSTTPKSIIPLTEMQAVFSDGNGSFKTDRQINEWIGTSRLVNIGRHQREDIRGVYEMNCGVQYLCRTGRMNVDASQKITLRGPGGRVIVDRSSITLEAPTIRIRGRVIVEEDAFERFEGVKSAIRDELPLAAECPVSRHADHGDT